MRTATRPVLIVAAGLIAALGAGALYVVSLTRGLGTIDSGELAAVCTTFGIAHPPGYPLYTLLGRAAVILLPPATPIVRLNLLSAIAMAAAVGFLAGFLLSEAATGGSRSTSTSTTTTTTAAPLALAIGISWIWAAGATVWNQAVVNEVYALHALFTVLLLGLGSRLVESCRTGNGQIDQIEGRRSDRTFLLLAYVTGLALVHHLSIAFTFPAIGWALLVHLRGNRPRFGKRHAFPALIMLVLGLSPLLYLPLRSSHNPLLDWGNPETWTTFWRHITGKQYQVWFLASGSLLQSNLEAFLSRLPRDCGWPLLGAAMLGCVALLARQRLAKAVYWMLAFVVTALWASAYDIHDLAPYYLPAAVALAALGWEGLRFLAELLAGSSGAGSPRVRLAGWTIIGILACSAAANSVALRWSRCSHRGYVWPSHYARTLLQGLPRNALILSRQWDTFVSASIYLQLVEGVRPDVTIVDTELLRRSWYFPQLARWRPWLLPPIEAELIAFLRELAPFEDGRPYDPGSIEIHYRTLMRMMLERHSRDHPVGITPEVELGMAYPRDPTLWVPVPHGLLFVLTESLEGIAGRGPLPDPAVLILSPGPPAQVDPIRAMAIALSHRMTMARADALQQMKRQEEAEALKKEVAVLAAASRGGGVK